MGRKAANRRGPSQARGRDWDDPLPVSEPPPPPPPRVYSEAEQAAIDARGAPLTEDEIRNRAEALRNAR